MAVTEKLTSDEIDWQPNRHTLLLALTDPEQGGMSPRCPPYGDATLRSGALLVLPAGLQTRSWSRPSRWANAFLSPTLFDAAALETRGGRPIEPPLYGAFTDAFIEEAMRALVREMGVPDSANRLLVDGLATAIAVRIARLAGEVAEPTASALPQPRLRRVLDHIEAHLSEALSLPRLARVACLSPAHFSRSFKHAIGVGPHRYVRTRRIERAKALLRPGGPPIACIAVMVGFGDQAHFTNAFRCATGTTPARYRAGLAA